MVKKWKLSNCYSPTNQTDGGKWHAVEYEKNIKSAVYDHLAIVPDPRYSESIILTPEEFKVYNEQKEIELKKLSNSS